MKPKIGYLIIREDIFSPIVKTQVLDMLKLINKEEFDLVILWACRFDYLLRNNEQYRKIESFLKENNIDLLRLPVFVLKFPLSKAQLKLLEIQLVLRLKLIIRRYNIRILHARGYNAGYISAKIREKYFPVKSIFDARSPYLTEIQSTYNIRSDSKKFRAWHSLERYILRNSTISVATTDRFREYLLLNSNHVVTIPNNAEMTDKNQILALSKSQARKSICYVGSIGYGWNDIRIYAEFTKNIIEKYHDIHFEYYVHEKNIETVVNEFHKIGIQKERYTVENISPNEIQSKISGCLCGMQIMSKPDVRLGIKTVDYLSSGVPVICNENAIGANELVDKYKVGICFNDKVSAEVYRFIESQLICNSDLALRCLNIAETKFSTKAIAKMYEEIYKTCLSYNSE